jgi:hypothetical protein
MTAIMWDWIGKTSGLVGLFGSVAALLAWLQTLKISADVEREKRRLNQEVSIILKSTEDESNTIPIPFALRRGEITRSEVLGLIGMLAMCEDLKRTRYQIQFLSSAAFREEMSKIQDSDEASELIIPCSDGEIRQFDCKAVQKND